MTTDYKQLTQSIVHSTQTLCDYDALDVAELCALSRLKVQLYMLSAMHGTGLHADESYRCSLRQLGEYVIDACMDSDDAEDLAMLSQALFDLSRTGLADYTNERMNLDRMLVEDAMQQSHYRPVHAALNMLMQQPLTQIEYDNAKPTHRRYTFSIGREFYEDTLRTWAAAQHDDGSWTGVSLAEAMSRISIFEADFGSLPGIDNRRVSESGYRHYSTHQCTTATDLSNTYHACVHRIGYKPQPSHAHRFITHSLHLLNTSHPTLSHRLTLNSIILSATTLA